MPGYDTASADTNTHVPRSEKIRYNSTLLRSHVVEAANWRLALDRAAVHAGPVHAQHGARFGTSALSSSLFLRSAGARIKKRVFAICLAAVAVLRLELGDGELHVPVVIFWARPRSGLASGQWGEIKRTVRS